MKGRETCEIEGETHRDGGSEKDFPGKVSYPQKSNTKVGEHETSKTGLI